MDIEDFKRKRLSTRTKRERTAADSRDRAREQHELVVAAFSAIHAQLVSLNEAAGTEIGLGTTSASWKDEHGLIELALEVQLRDQEMVWMVKETHTHKGFNDLNEYGDYMPPTTEVHEFSSADPALDRFLDAIAEED
jgi:hypothetical protein